MARRYLGETPPTDPEHLADKAYVDEAVAAVPVIDGLDDLGVTASASELNILDGATLSTTELNYVDGVTSSIQEQLNAKYGAGGTDVALADGGTGASLSDPNADRILFWDDSAGAVTWLAPDGTNLTISGTTLNIGSGVYRSGGTDVALADGGTGASLTDPNADRIMFWDDSAGAVTWLAPGTNISISGTTLDVSAGLASWASKTAPSGTVVGTSDDQTLTNKNLASSTNTFPNDVPRVLVFNGSSWPDRPNDSRPTFFIGGTDPDDEPDDADLQAGDVWIPEGS